MDPSLPNVPTFMASFTDTLESRVCGRESCKRPYRDCTQEEKVLWKRLANSRNTMGNTVRWVCGACAEYYHSKVTTQRRDDSITVSRESRDEYADIRKNITAANQGRGGRKLVEVVGSVVPQMRSVSSQSYQTSSTQDRVQVQDTWTRGCAYQSELQPLRPLRPSQPSQSSRPRVQAARGHGYTQNHTHFQDHLSGWSRKTSSSGNVRDVVAVLVYMGVVLPGRKNISVIDTCLEGLDNVDAHIGGDELHLMCYNALQQKWAAWSNGYMVPIERTTLRGMKIFAAIAGQDLTMPAKQRDAIWHFVFKVRGRSTEPKFKAEQLQLVVVIDHKDYAIAKLRNLKEETEELNEVTGVDSPTRTTDTRHYARHGPSRKCRETRRKLTHSNTSDLKDFSDFEDSSEASDIEDPVAAQVTASSASEFIPDTQKKPKGLEGCGSGLNSDSDDSQSDPDNTRSELPDGLESGVSRTAGFNLKRARPTTPENSSKRQKQVDFVSPQRDQFLSALCKQYKQSKAQDTAAFLNKNAFQCAFYEIPVARYDPKKLPRDVLTLYDSDIKIHHGTLSVDFAPRLAQMGSFKTSHPGKVQLDNNSELPPFTNGTVCVKQMYERKGASSNGTGAISRLKGHVELDALLIECNCVRWASILLDLTYQFVDRELKKRGNPPYSIPKLRFTRVMIAVVHDLPTSKAFLVEEWINTDNGDHQFIKYLNNRVPHRSHHILDSVPQAPKAREIVDFLIFAQHVQWEKSQYLAFTSDYQGAGDLLTDPQIMSNPIHGYLFGDGNIPRVFKEFRSNHRCNHFCEFFELTLDIPPPSP